MRRLTITASPLAGRWSVTSAVDRARVAWPPSPDTMFSALVAAAGSLGTACHPALYWLERQGNPDIDAPSLDEVGFVESISHYQPVADRPIWQKGSRQAQYHNSVGYGGAVTWSWTVADDAPLDALKQIAAEVPYIGSSRGPVLVSAALSERDRAPETLVPSETGLFRLRGLFVGRLDELEAAYQAGRRPRPADTVPYTRFAEHREGPRWSQVIPLRRASGQRLGVAYAVPIAEAVRAALTSHMRDPAPSVLTGHGPAGEPLRSDHLAIVPLPRVGDPHADGEVFGVALVVPADCNDDAFQHLVDALGRWLAAGGVVDLGSLRWQMELAHDDPRSTLRTSRWTRAAKAWATVTPAVLDRFPRRNLTVERVVEEMCVGSGLPRPISVAATANSVWWGAVSTSQHRLGGRAYLEKRLRLHLQLSWAVPISGPVLLGQGRYFGLGAFLPVGDAA